MSDAVLYCRTLATRLAEGGQALRVAARNWRNTVDGGRAAWDDEAGRQVFQRYLDPYGELLDGAEAALLTATTQHQAAMDQLDEGDRSAAEALAAAREAAAHARDAMNAALTARSDSDTACSRAATALAEARAAISQLGGE